MSAAPGKIMLTALYVSVHAPAKIVSLRIPSAAAEIADIVAVPVIVCTLFISVIVAALATSLPTPPLWRPFMNAVARRDPGIFRNRISRRKSGGKLRNAILHYCQK
jgi:hypothetical protein